MESHLSPRFKKWMKKCLSDEFSKAIEDNLNGDREPYDVAQKIINSSQMTELTHTIRTSFVEQLEASRAATRQNSALNSAVNSRPQTAMSYTNGMVADDDDDDDDDDDNDDGDDDDEDGDVDDWSLKGSNGTDEIGQIVNRMGFNRPDHVRLAGYEALLELDLSNLTTNRSWSALLKTLRDGLMNGSRSVFESSLLVHAKLLNCQLFQEAYMNLLNSFNEMYHSTKLYDTLPTLLGGVNFKVFLHEKLFRVMRLLLDQHEETLKGTRASDKSLEEMIEQFVSFLSNHTAMTPATVQARPLSALHILAVIEPQAGWSRKWMHALATRKTLCSAISKSPSFLQNTVASVKKHLENTPTTISASISDEPADVYVSGDSVETLHFLHNLNLLTQLCSCATGRALINETLNEDAFSMPDFMSALLSSLNILAASDASNGVYEAIRTALASMIRRPLVLYDARFYRLTLSPLVQQEVRMWPHTLDVLDHMLDTQDGTAFLTSEDRANSASLEVRKKSATTTYPVTIIIKYTANQLRQPVAVMSMDHIVELCRFIGKLFNDLEIFYFVEGILRENFYPSISYMYSKIDKYYLENENKTQHLDKAVREMLLNIVSVPLGLQILSNEPLIFEELIRGSIAPVRASWSAYDVVAFISSSAFLKRGKEVLMNLASHVLSTLLVELGKTFEDPKEFHDPWESENVKTFLHVLALFSLNINCFMAFMNDESDDNNDDENEYPANLYELFQNFMNMDTPYHHLGLLSFKVLLWNLDIYVHLINSLDFQNQFLLFQEFGSFVNEDGLEQKTFYIVDECSLLRHVILLNCYYVRHARSEHMVIPEETRLFSKMPPPMGIDDDVVPSTTSETELTSWLQDTGPGFRDMNWVSQTQKAHKGSIAPMTGATLLNLLDQMEQSIPTVEWLDRYQWDVFSEYKDDYWLPEEMCAMDLAIHYGVINGQIEKTEHTKSDLKLFIRASHKFINYNKPASFEGFDWFLATIFLICKGNVDKSRQFVSKIMRFPSAVFMWPALGKVIDDNNEEEASTKLIFGHLLENIISLEFPTTRFALKRECGVEWWMICDRLLAQCFWGILPWSEILQFIAICILHTPDYVLYYCASLLCHCDGDLMKNVVNGKMWPEDLILEDYRCHSQIGFMDRLGKRHGGKVLPPLSQRTLDFSENQT